MPDIFTIRAEARKETQRKYYQQNKEAIKMRARERRGGLDPSKLITIGPHKFRYKKGVLLHFKEMLANGEVGDELPYDELSSLIARHPDYEPCWLDGAVFAIGRAAMGHKCFRVANNTGSFPFSYHKCVSSSDRFKYVRRNVQMAARLAIVCQINEFRAKAEPICAVSGEHLSPEQIHVDHDFTRKTFQDLLDGWLRDNKWKYDDIPLIKGDDEMYHIDEPYKWSWRDFHKQHARLRIVRDAINCRGAISE